MKFSGISKHRQFTGSGTGLPVIMPGRACRCGYRLLRARRRSLRKTARSTSSGRKAVAHRVGNQYLLMIDSLFVSISGSFCYLFVKLMKIRHIAKYFLHF